MGLFFNYGKNAGQNVRRILPNNTDYVIDTLKPSRGFIEAEFGFMLHEELRLSGGGGMMNYNQVKDSFLSQGSQMYYSFTVGLAPRLFNFLEADLNLSALYINGKFQPRANMNLVILLKTGKFR